MKNLVLLFLCLPVLCVAQNDSTASIPVVDGKVVFSASYEPSLTKQEIQDQLLDLLSSKFSDKGVLALNDYEQGIIAFRMKDYLPIEEKLLMSFAMNIRYTLIFEYGDNSCSIKIRNLSYTEPEDKSNSEVYLAEYILIDKKYKVLTIKDASEKITNRTLEYVEQLFKQFSNKFIF